MKEIIITGIITEDSSGQSIVVEADQPIYFFKGKKKYKASYLYMLPPETLKPVCKKCGTNLNKKGLCKDVTCPYSDRQQSETYTED